MLGIRQGAVLFKISSLSSFEPFTDHPGRNRREALRVGKARQHQEAELLPPGRSKLGKISALRALLRKSNYEQELPWCRGLMFVALALKAEDSRFESLYTVEENRTRVLEVGTIWHQGFLYLSHLGTNQT